MGKGTAKKLAVGTAVAAAAGYVAGILTAPKSGKETRQDIKDKAGEVKDSAEEQIKKLQAEVEELARKAKGKAGDELDALVSRAKEAKNKAGDMASGLRSGEASDKDLQKAIDDAKKAVDHLRDYLAK